MAIRREWESEDIQPAFLAWNGTFGVSLAQIQVVQYILLQQSEEGYVTRRKVWQKLKPSFGTRPRHSCLNPHTVHIPRPSVSISFPRSDISWSLDGRARKEAKEGQEGLL
jgi:hypothetical protein